jgi:hypothetical protein
VWWCGVVFVYSAESTQQRNTDASSIAKLRSDLAAAQATIDALKQQTTQLNQSSSEAVDSMRKEMAKLQSDARETAEKERAETTRAMAELRAEQQKELEARAREYELKEAAHRNELSRIDERARNDIAAMRRQMQDALDVWCRLYAAVGCMLCCTNSSRSGTSL